MLDGGYCLFQVKCVAPKTEIEFKGFGLIFTRKRLAPEILWERKMYKIDPYKGKKIHQKIILFNFV